MIWILDRTDGSYTASAFGRAFALDVWRREAKLYVDVRSARGKHRKHLIDFPTGDAEEAKNRASLWIRKHGQTLTKPDVFVSESNKWSKKMRYNPRTRNFAERGETKFKRILERRSNPMKVTSGPSLKKLEALISSVKGDVSAAIRIKELISKGAPKKALGVYDTAVGNYGVEFLTGGLYYSNTGDTYLTTLLYDLRKSRVFIGNWGDMVERYPKRFGIEEW